MQPDEIDALLAASAADGKFTGGERNRLLETLDRERADDADLNLVRNRAFELAKRSVGTPAAAAWIDWLGEVNRVLTTRQRPVGGPLSGGRDAVTSEAYFAPEDDCPAAIIRLIRQARASIDVCVFTITDDRISIPLVDAHRRGVAVRVLTDNEKLHDPGSDIPRFRDAGVPVRIDETQYHMHHKFALFDRAKLLTGSYNWTRGAAQFNEEHFIVTNDPALLKTFDAAFERLWKKLDPS